MIPAFGWGNSKWLVCLFVFVFLIEMISFPFVSFARCKPWSPIGFVLFWPMWVFDRFNPKWIQPWIWIPMMICLIQGCCKGLIRFCVKVRASILRSGKITNWSSFGFDPKWSCLHKDAVKDWYIFGPRSKLQFWGPEKLRNVSIQPWIWPLMIIYTQGCCKGLIPFWVKVKASILSSLKLRNVSSLGFDLKWSLFNNFKA